MGKKIAPLLLMAAAFVFASCLNSDDDDDVTYYNDTAIVSFSLGTLNRYLHTTSSAGTDSIYKTTVTGSNYKFHIDQTLREIYNPDSLPYGTDATKVVCAISSKNSGTVVLLNMTGDSIRYYSSSDSIDFSQPREFRVYSNNGSAYRAYTVRVNVHQEQADSFYWSQMASAPSIAPVGSSHARQYKLENGSLLSSTDNGATWETETLDGDQALLPTANANFACRPVNTNDSTDYMLLVGTSDADTKHAVCWFKYDEYSTGAGNNAWSYLSAGNENLYPLPKLSNLQVVRYGDYLLAIGGAGMDDCTQTAYSAIYTSHDGGISWIPDDVATFPEGFDTSATNVKMMVDDEMYIWLVCEGTGQIWRGRLNQYGWTETQRSFHE